MDNESERHPVKPIITHHVNMRISPGQLMIFNSGVAGSGGGKHRRPF
jgi:hypothetical protein